MLEIVEKSMGKLMFLYNFPIDVKLLETGHNLILLLVHDVLELSVKEGD